MGICKGFTLYKPGIKRNLGCIISSHFREEEVFMNMDYVWEILKSPYTEIKVDHSTLPTEKQIQNSILNLKTEVGEYTLKAILFLGFGFALSEGIWLLGVVVSSILALVFAFKHFGQKAADMANQVSTIVSKGAVIQRNVTESQKDLTEDNEFNIMMHQHLTAGVIFWRIISIISVILVLLSFQGSAWTLLFGFVVLPAWYALSVTMIFAAAQAAKDDFTISLAAILNMLFNTDSLTTSKQ